MQTRPYSKPGAAWGWRIKFKCEQIGLKARLGGHLATPANVAGHRGGATKRCLRGRAGQSRNR